MQPSNLFHPQRMLFYGQKHFTDHLRFYLMSLFAVFGLMTIWPLLMLFTNNPIDRLSDLAPFYYIGLFFGGMLFTSRFFHELGSKEKGVDFLMLPASQFEKFIIIFLVSTAGFLLCYHLCCFLSFNIINNAQVAILRKPVKMDYSFLSDPDEKKYIYYIYFILQAAFLLGATYFHKYSFIKTVLAVFIFLFALWLVHAFIISCIFGFGGEFWKRSIPFTMIAKLEGGPVSWHTTVYLIPHWLQETYLFAVRFLVAPVLWTIAYFRLKDQEI
jgi:hypothetical protein